MAGRVMRWGIVVVMALALAGFTSAGAQTPAAQDAGCEGIEAYVTALENASAQLDGALGGSDEEDVTTWTPEDFTARAELIRQERESFAQIVPPPIAEPFHTALLDQLDLVAQMFDTMSTAGVFGALIYSEQADALQQTMEDAAAEIETACGIDLMEDLDTEDTESDVSAGAGSATAIASSTTSGTRSDPIPIGETVRLDDDWELTVLGVEPDASEAIVAADSFNDPPAPGKQFFMATVRVTYLGETSDEFSAWRLRAVGQSARAYDQFTDSCGWSIPDELESRELFTGGAIEGTICWAIDTADADSLVMYDGDQSSSKRVFFSLMPGAPAATPEVAGDVATPDGEMGGFRGAVASAVSQLSGTPATPERELAIADSGFQPSMLVLSASDLPVTIALTNTGSATHGFTIVELDIDRTIEAGATELITIPAGTAPGNYVFESAPEGATEAGSTGTLIVR